MTRNAPIFVLAVATAVLSGCSGTDGTLGDVGARPLASDLGDGSRLSGVIGAATWVDPANAMSSDCAYPPDEPIFATGLVVNAVDTFDETMSGAVGTYYVEDASPTPKPYSGVDVFGPSFSPPDLRLAAGDVVDMLGVYTEFPGPSTFIFNQCKTIPELRGTMSFRFEDGPLTPITIPLADLATYATARKWLGMLVRVEKIAITGTSTDSKGRYSANINIGDALQSDIPTVDNELYDVVGQGPVIQSGTKFSAVTGIVTFFANFHIAPRSPADFEK